MIQDPGYWLVAALLFAVERNTKLAGSSLGLGSADGTSATTGSTTATSNVENNRVSLPGLGAPSREAHWLFGCSRACHDRQTSPTEGSNPTSRSRAVLVTRTSLLKLRLETQRHSSFASALTTSSSSSATASDSCTGSFDGENVTLCLAPISATRACSTFGTDKQRQQSGTLTPRY